MTLCGAPSHMRSCTCLMTLCSCNAGQKAGGSSASHPLEAMLHQQRVWETTRKVQTSPAEVQDLANQVSSRHFGQFPSIGTLWVGLSVPVLRIKNQTPCSSPCSDPQSIAEKRGRETGSGRQPGDCLITYGSPALTQPLPTKVPARGVPATVQLQESPVRKRIEESWKQGRQSTQSLTSQGTSSPKSSCLT